MLWSKRPGIDFRLWEQGCVGRKIFLPSTLPLQGHMELSIGNSARNGNDEGPVHFRQGLLYLFAVIAWPILAVEGFFVLRGLLAGILQFLFLSGLAVWVITHLPWRLAIKENRIEMTFTPLSLFRSHVSKSDISSIRAKLVSRRNILGSSYNYVRLETRNALLRLGPIQIHVVYLSGAPIRGFDRNSRELSKVLLNFDYPMESDANR